MKRNWDIDIVFWVWLIFIVLNYFFNYFVFRFGCEKMYYFIEFVLVFNDFDDSVVLIDFRRRLD